MSFLQECLTKFDSLPTDFKNRIGSLEVFEKIEAIEEQYGIDLKFLVILVAIGEVAVKDIPEYLQARHTLAEEDAIEIRDAIINDVFQLVGEEEQDDNIYSMPKNEVILVFQEKLVEILHGDLENTAGKINGLNQAIFYWLSKDGTIQEELSKILLSNQERLTEARIIFENREVDPTISYWLKDFIKQNGSEMFDELVLAQYLSSSLNTKKLSPTAKDILRKLLKLYRNLSFFPDSMENAPVNDWQIIPIFRDALSDEKLEINNKIVRENINLDKIVDKKVDKKVDTNQKKVQEIVPTLLAQNANEQTLIIKPEISSESSQADLLAELQQALAQYIPGTLEYKAVTQEIERLKKKK